MCRALGVNRTSFHDWERRAPSDRALTDAWLTEKIKQIHADSDGTYGARRVHAELRLEHGIRVGRKRVERLMRGGRYLRASAAQAPAHHGPAARRQGRCRPRRARLSPDGPNQTWSADITYISTWEGFALPRARPGPVLPADRRLVDGRPPALRARRRRARDGACPTSPRPRA